MNKIKSIEVQAAFNTYPVNMRKKLLVLRQLILDTATQTNEGQALEETLKWHEPAYITKEGSTIRIAWKRSRPDEYAMYFNCKTKLVETFRTLYSQQFKFEGKRAILFHKDDTIPISELEHCISMALTYHKCKHLPLLGAKKATTSKAKHRETL